MTDATASTDTPTNAKAESRWPRWVVQLGVILAVGAPVLVLVMALATGAGLLGWETSLGSLRVLLMVGAAGAVISLVGLVIVLFKRRKPLIKWGLLGVIMGGGFIVYAMMWFNHMSSVPPIHDITTDLDSPPGFQQLELRADNRETVPPGEDVRMADMDNAMRWRLYHEEAYGDIQPIGVPTSVPATIAAAEELVADRGWELVIADPATGHLEATESVSLYGFKDDVVLRVTPNSNGEGSIVNMRSVSRVGVSDLGVNAERVREFLADLSAATAG